jgi:rubrerythrin
MDEHVHDRAPRSAVDELRDDASSRKRFLKLAGGGALASTFALLAAACGDDEEDGAAGGQGADTQARTTTGMGGDLEIVNYALTLEYLEADFYEQVIDSGAITDMSVAELAKSIGENEQEHVEALLATAKSLGTPAEKPRTDFQSVLEGGPEMILSTAATVENLGAAAYLGQAGRIKDKEILAAALSIHSVEARHAAALNDLAGTGFTGDGPLSGSIPDGAFAKPMTMAEVLEQVQPFLAA